MAEIKVGIIVDWARAGRGNAWPLLLAELKPTPIVTTYPIADLITKPVDGEAGLQSIDEEQVLVINWDAANGDPEFGAHLCQRWLQHRGPEIVEWVNRGGILLIESQTVLGVPCAAAYEAVVGPGELPTCGPEDRTQPLQKRRSGLSCRKSKRFPTEQGFVHVPDVLRSGGSYPAVQEFPDSTTGFLKAALKEMPAEPTLWRGWFRRSLPFSRHFRWVSLLETEAGWLRRQSVMQVATVGEGAIFATTMLLATTQQRSLVRAILQCAGGETGHLPRPVRALDRVKGGVKTVLGLVGGSVAGLIAGSSDSLVNGLTPAAGLLGMAPKDLIRALLVPAGIAAVAIGYWLIQRAGRSARSFIGY